jgi:hypothetical protein
MSSQDLVDLGLITRTSRLKPLEHVGIDPERYLLLDWPVELAGFGQRPIGQLRNF